MAGPKAYETELRESFETLLREAGAYFAHAGRLYDTMRRLALRLDSEGIPYAVAGAIAVGRHGYVRMTEDVDLLLTRSGLDRFRERLEGRGYVATHPGAARSFRDVETGVRIEMLVTGEYPGDGKPKPVAFPDPADVAVEVEGLRLLPLPCLVELKLASGMTASHRLRDLADVQELIKSQSLDEDFADRLHPSVRPRYLELLAAVRSGPPDVDRE